jgi:predicted GNAT family N-acyltransferase
MAYTVRRIRLAWEMERAYSLRILVFVQEQGVPKEIERDDLDDNAIHAIALNGNTVVGTGRLVLTASRFGVIGRMAVKKSSRRKGIGARMLAFLENEALTHNLQRISLHAQEHAKAFYLLQGYREDGDIFTEAEILHRQMYKDLK